MRGHSSPSPAIKTLTRSSIDQSGLSPLDAPVEGCGSGHQLLRPAGFGLERSGWRGGVGRGSLADTNLCVFVCKREGNGRKRAATVAVVGEVAGGAAESERHNGRSGTAVGAAASPLTSASPDYTTHVLTVPPLCLQHFYPRLPSLHPTASLLKSAGSLV